MSKRDAAIYREAADLAEIGAYACNALAICVEGRFAERDELPIVRRFTAMFSPDSLPEDHETHGWYGAPTKAARDARVIALCLAAAMAETGDL